MNPRRFLVRALIRLAAFLSEPTEWYDSNTEAEISIAVRCPYCERTAGRPCRRSKPDKRPHLERRLAALNQLEFHQ